MRGTPHPILVLDQGNSRLKAGRFEQGRLTALRSFTTGDPAALDAFVGAGTLQRIVIGSVGRLDPSVMDWAKARATVQVITTEGPSSLRNAYRTPLTLGVDRLANAVAGHAWCPDRPVLAIDAGSCITYDLTLADGTYLGGAISPGLGMRAKAMHQHSARLPLVELPPEVPLLGTDTVGSLSSGIFHGALFEVQGYIRAFMQQHPALAVVVTGGDALRIVRGVKSSIFAHPSLTLLGLHALHEQQLA